MNEFLKVGEQYVPVTYVTRPKDSFWELRESIELTAELTLDQLSTLFKGGKWSLFKKNVKQVPDEPTDGDEAPMTYHEETEYIETDMSDYCVCGWVRDNIDGTSTVKMGKLSELEKAIEVMIGGI